MKKIVFILVVIVALGGLVYGLGIGPFGENAAKGKKQGRRRGDGRTVTVRVEKVKMGDVEEKLSYVGSLTANASVTVAPKISGRVEKIFVDVGDAVKEGQVLARLEKDEFREEVREAEASLKVYEATLKGKDAEHKDLKRKVDRAKILFEKHLISREEVDTLETQFLSAIAQVELTQAQMAQMRARLDNTRIRLKHGDVVAPFAGYIGQRFVDRGALIDSGTPLVSVVDLSTVKVDVAAVERDYRKISSGKVATIEVDAYPGKRFRGKVTRIAPVLNEETRTGDVVIELTNESGELKPGMFARVELVAQRRTGVLLVPEGARVKTRRGAGIFKLYRTESKVKLVPIQAGLVHEGWIEVRGELEAGDRVVTLGSNLLRDGQKVRLVDGSDPTRKKKGRKKGSGKKSS